MIKKFIRNETLNLICAFIALTFCFMFYGMSSWLYFGVSSIFLVGFVWHWCDIIFEEADRDKTGK